MPYAIDEETVLAYACPFLAFPLPDLTSTSCQGAHRGRRDEVDERSPLRNQCPDTSESKYTTDEPVVQKIMGTVRFAGAYAPRLTARRHVPIKSHRCVTSFPVITHRQERSETTQLRVKHRIVHDVPVDPMYLIDPRNLRRFHTVQPDCPPAQRRGLSRSGIPLLLPVLGRQAMADLQD